MVPLTKRVSLNLLALLARVHVLACCVSARLSCTCRHVATALPARAFDLGVHARARVLLCVHVCACMCCTCTTALGTTACACTCAARQRSARAHTRTRSLKLQAWAVLVAIVPLTHSHTRTVRMRRSPVTAVYVCACNQHSLIHAYIAHDQITIHVRQRYLHSASAIARYSATLVLWRHSYSDASVTS